MQSFFGEVRVTLYDIFGYLLPGLVALTAISVFFWAVFVPKAQPDVSLSGVVWVALFLVAYFLGHVLAQLTNWLPIFNPTIQGDWSSDEVVGPYLHIIDKKLQSKGLTDRTIGSTSMYMLCDELLVQKGVTTDREIYTYREGFYRGMSAALVLLSIALFVRLGVSHVSFKVDKAHPVSRPMLAFLGGLVLLSAIPFYSRSRRFLRYRQREILLAAPILLSDLSSAAPGSKGGTDE